MRFPLFTRLFASILRGPHADEPHAECCGGEWLLQLLRAFREHSERLIVFLPKPLAFGAVHALIISGRETTNYDSHYNALQL